MDPKLRAIKGIAECRGRFLRNNQNIWDIKNFKNEVSKSLKRLPFLTKGDIDFIDSLDYQDIYNRS